MTDRQRKVLAVLLAREAECAEWENKSLTCNEIGGLLGLSGPHGGNGLGGRGRGSRVFGPGQRVISSVTGLERRGLVQLGKRRDGRSGTAYRLTDAGREEAQRNA